jgi:hypothetical protein
MKFIHFSHQTCVREVLIPKLAAKFAVVVRSLGNRKVLAVLVTVQSDLQSGLVVV